MNQILSNRSQSGFPLSIGSSLALESLFKPIQSVYDETRQIPNTIDITKYSNFIFNISTLLRNILSSVSSQEVLVLPKKDILDTLLEEIDWLNNFFQMSGLNINFYIHNYNFVHNNYKDILRKATTEKQIYLDGIYTFCLKGISKEDDVKEFSNDIKYTKEDSALIFTHVPWDLLSYRNFIKLDLLESHTGILKTRKLWNTKYHKLPGDRDMSFLPFMEYLLTTFGDNIMFHPAPLKDRLELYESMKKRNVHPLMDELSFEFIFGNKL